MPSPRRVEHHFIPKKIISLLILFPSLFPLENLSTTAIYYPALFLVQVYILAFRGGLCQMLLWSLSINYAYIHIFPALKGFLSFSEPKLSNCKHWIFPSDLTISSFSFFSIVLHSRIVNDTDLYIPMTFSIIFSWSGSMLTFFNMSVFFSWI